jgi:hypothetical protein
MRTEVIMKKFFAYIEDLWVAVTFAEAGVSETGQTKKIHIPYRENVSVHAR